MKVLGQQLFDEQGHALGAGGQYLDQRLGRLALLGAQAGARHLSDGGRVEPLQGQHLGAPAPLERVDQLARRALEPRGAEEDHRHECRVVGQVGGDSKRVLACPVQIVEHEQRARCAAE